jgi:AraC-like DNA-binding protein
MRTGGKNQYHYFSVGDEDLATGLYLTSYGCNVAPPHCEYPAPGHPPDFNFTWNKGRILTDTALIFISQGAGFIELETGRLPWRAGECVLLPPGVWHRYQPQLATGWREHWLTLSGEWMGRFWQRHAGEIVIRPLRMASPAEFLVDFNRFHRHAARRAGQVTAWQSLSLVAEGVQLVGQVVDEQLKAPAPPHAEDLLARARRFIWNNSHRPLDMKQIAAELGVSRRTLERRFAEQSERTLREELEWHRTSRARKLLADTRRPIKEIAYLCGFAEQRGLIRAFKRWHGVVPGSVRAVGR